MHIDELAEDTSELLSHLYDASIQSSMGGLGGCKHFEIEAFPAKFQKYIQNYVDAKRDSSQCIIDYLYENHYLFTGARI